MTRTRSPSWKVGALGFEGSFLIPRPMLSATQVSAGGTVAELWPRNGMGWKRGAPRHKGAPFALQGTQWIHPAQAWGVQRKG